MKHHAFIALMVAVLSAACATASSDDAVAVQGDWLPTSAVLGGQPLSDAQLKAISMHLGNGEYLVMADNTPDRGIYTIEKATLRGMTITGTDGPNKGKTFPAIFEIHGDTLRICYDLSGAKRPTEFKSAPGTQLFLVTYQRAKK